MGNSTVEGEQQRKKARLGHGESEEGDSKQVEGEEESVTKTRVSLNPIDFEDVNNATVEMFMEKAPHFKGKRELVECALNALKNATEEAPAMVFFFGDKANIRQGASDLCQGSPYSYGGTQAATVDNLRAWIVGLATRNEAAGMVGETQRHGVTFPNMTASESHNFCADIGRIEANWAPNLATRPNSPSLGIIYVGVGRSLTPLHSAVFFG